MKRKSVKLVKLCPVCNESFSTYPSINKICCSSKCSYKRQTEIAIKQNTTVCKNCGESFVPKHTTKKGDNIHGVYCSHKCFGEYNSMAYVMRSGYRYLHVPEHPLASKQGYYAEHRYIMEIHLGRLLNKKERVHHINKIKTDNRIENLVWVESAGKHFIEHHLSSRDNKGKFR